MMRWIGVPVAALLLAASLVVLVQIHGLRPAHGAEQHRCSGEIVEASWYGTESGSRTATGEHFDGSTFTAAMPTREHLGEHYRVTHMKTGKSVKVRINDVGPAPRTGRGIDLARRAGAAIGLIRDGYGRVCLERIR